MHDPLQLVAPFPAAAAAAAQQQPPPPDGVHRNGAGPHLQVSQATPSATEADHLALRVKLGIPDAAVVEFELPPVDAAAEESRLLLAGLYPPASAHPDAQHDNATSRSLRAAMGGDNFDWVDLCLLSPRLRAKELLQNELARAIRADPRFAASFARRIRARVLELARRPDPAAVQAHLPVVAWGGVLVQEALTAAGQGGFFQRVAAIGIPGAAVLFRDTDTAVLFLALTGAPHPSGHLMAGCEPTAVERFNDTFKTGAAAVSIASSAVATSLIAAASGTGDSSIAAAAAAYSEAVMGKMGADVRDRQASLRAVAQRLGVLDVDKSGDTGAWLQTEWRHLRLRNWAPGGGAFGGLQALELTCGNNMVTMRGIMKLGGVVAQLGDAAFDARLRAWLAQLGVAGFVTFMGRDGVATQLGDAAFDARLRVWLAQLGADGFVTFMSGRGVATQLLDVAFDARLRAWLAQLGAAGFVTFMNGRGVAAQLLDAAFDARLREWLAQLGVAGFVTFMSGRGVAARLLVSDFSARFLFVYLYTPSANQGRVITIAGLCSALWPLEGPNLEGRRAAFWAVLLQMLNETGAVTVKKFKAAISAVVEA